MKVLHVVPSLDASQGGIRTALAGTIRAQIEAGIQVVCACVEPPDPPLAGIPVQAFKASSPRLTRASAAMKAWLATHAGEFDAIVAHTLWLSPTRYAVDAARGAGVPVFLAPHGMLDPDALAHHAWRKRLRWLGGEGRRVRACRLVFSTQADADRARRTTEARDLPYAVIPNPVDARWQPAPSRLHATPVVLCLNRLHPRKGVLELVRALLLLHRRGVRFDARFAGHAEDTEYAARTRREAAPLEKAGALHWLGVLDADATLALVQSANLLVHPATGFENFGMVIAEAASAGVCVLASPRALLAPEMAAAGALESCEPEPRALADALGRLLTDPARVQALGAAGRAYATRFAPAEVARQWRSLLAGGRKV